MVITEPKYIFIEGRPVINTNFLAQNRTEETGVSSRAAAMQSTSHTAQPEQDVTLTHGDKMVVLDQVVISTEPKYVLDSMGRPVINANFLAQQESQSRHAGPSAPPAPQLTVVSTMEDQLAISQLIPDRPVPQQFQDTIIAMQGSEFLAGFGLERVNGGAIIDGLSNVFSRYEIPIGLMSKLVPFQNSAMHFKIDDSGSMTGLSSLHLSDASDYMKAILTTGVRSSNPNQQLTRWQEAEDRLHVIIEMLAYVPTGPIKLSFFDRPGSPPAPGFFITLDRRGKEPAEFLKEAHEQINKLFREHRPNGNTPIHHNLTHMLDEANRSHANKTNHYVISDGEPNGFVGEVASIQTLLKSSGRRAEFNPVSFLSCSNKPDDCAWMSEVEKVVPYASASSDFLEEYKEVKKNQGNYFPYSRGFWILCNLAAACNPDDLDAMDEHAPFTMAMLENLMGRPMALAEYRTYFDGHPHARRIYGPDEKRFVGEALSKNIPSVQLFNQVFKEQLQRNIAAGRQNSEDEAVRTAETAVLRSRVSQQPANTSYASTSGTATNAHYSAAPHVNTLFNGAQATTRPSHNRPAPVDQGCTCVLL